MMREISKRLAKENGWRGKGLRGRGAEVEVKAEADLYK